MSLVDYASDEADSNEDEDEPGTAPGPAVHGDAAAGASSSDSVAMDTDSKAEVPQQNNVPTARIQLPDVSLLLGPSDSAIATTSSAQRKREPAANGSGHQLPNSKVPRGNLRPSRTPPDTAGGLLTPPQLRGRSNVATEDLDKIFTRRQQRR
ncbi:hypothetical protein MPTK1_1g11070 [Marchantia polymorpha subsp. ruderalis]|uniref:Uncharacterized protein n=2 Tax=Marchantia polymorpha TaxID=3197 RepID=A0AAF6ANW2_MARPO|nr:hypothetical protein MARPO_0014s0118 [Marchantia polymorpha]BBM98132.1 hypothetical protein Mp_1g11070 [Marchantia polymorpha subsp. ruderalis]|eukprot:PTQ45591.1 hypothetical protein MARPO_0014s0118 [Marchantia polymorpha]